MEAQQGNELYIEELHNLCSVRNAIWMITSQTMRQKVHVERVDDVRSPQVNNFMETQRKRPLGKPILRWMDTRTILASTGYGLIHLKNPVAGLS
jgi:hypothetical protein